MIAQDYDRCCECNGIFVPRGMYYVDGKHICPACIEASINRKMRQAHDHWEKDQLFEFELEEVQEDGDDIRDQLAEAARKRFGI